MIQVVIGANFGDEGKGLMTDYFCRSHKGQKVLNIRMNGGAQAGHTVVTSKKERWEFAGIGAGSFNPGVDTYLSRHFIVNPYLLVMELYKLDVNFGIRPKVFVDAECAVTTLFDMTINQILEEYRGNTRHGSCGYGVFETWNRTTREDRIRYPLTIGMLKEMHDRGGSTVIAKILRDMQDNYVPTRLHELGISRNDLSNDVYDKLFCIETVGTNASMIEEMFSDIILADASVINQYEYLVFEGAQGLSLDMENTKYFPHLTPSKTGLMNVIDVLQSREHMENVEVCFMTRSYMTKHGAGEMATECSKEIIGNIYDKTNLKNPYQGTLRFGTIDKEELKGNIQRELILADTLHVPVKSSLCVTHMDQTDGMIAFTTGKEKLTDKLLQELDMDGTLYYADGETAGDVHQMD